MLLYYIYIHKLQAVQASYVDNAKGKLLDLTLN